MNRRIMSKGAVLLMGLAMICSLFGCSRNKAESELEFLEYRVSGYNPGYDVKFEDGKIIYENFDEGKKGKYRADENTVSQLMNTFKELDIYSWNGYDEYDEEMLDGMGFTLYVKFVDGTYINASGDNKFPENFGEFDDVMRLLMEK